MRNVVAHGYFAVSVAVIWETISGDLPPLVEALTDLLSALND